MSDAETGTLLLVTPPVTRMIDGVYEVEADFVNNLRLYLANFDHVTFAGPVFPDQKSRGTILRSVSLDKIAHSNRLTFIPLPYAYREDRYLRHYLPTRRLLTSEIAKAQYLIFSPHANFEWSTLAARLAIKAKRKFDIESDHDHASGINFHLKAMPNGPNKLRKTIWARSFLKTVEDCFSKSSLALLQGQEVFDAYKNIAPNAHKVLNVQVSAEDHIGPHQLAAKLDRMKKKDAPLSICYAGQAIARKGPFDWLRVIDGIIRAGVDVRATWFGEGPLISEMEQLAQDLRIEDKVAFPGPVGRTEIMAALQKNDIFLFCHKMSESPRCLGEALASGCALVGYGTAYPRELVANSGGGEFAEMDDWQKLVEIVASLDTDRGKLCCLTEAAAASGRLLDRDQAMQRRIDLIKKHLSA